MILSIKHPGILVVSILIDSCRQGSSWVVLPISSRVSETRNSRSVAARARPDIFFEDESDCPEEEECEIDWSAMPGFGDDDDEEEETKKDGSKEKETAANNQEAHLAFEDDELDELEPQEAYVRQMERTVEKSRTILEMNWQIENCVVDSDACTDFCTECAGSGKTWCKFCRGTGMIAFGNEFRSCMLCENGRVDCSACAGTGMISPWAKTHDNGTL